MDVKKYLNDRWGNIYNFDYPSITLVDEYTKNNKRYMLLKIGERVDYPSLKPDDDIFHMVFTDVKINGIDVNINYTKPSSKDYYFIYNRLRDFKLFDMNEEWMTFNRYLLPKQIIPSYSDITTFRDISKGLREMEQEFLEGLAKSINLEMSDIKTIEYKRYNIFVEIELEKGLPGFEYI